MTTDNIDSFIDILDIFVEKTRQNIQHISFENPQFIELEEMNLHAIYFLSMCSNIRKFSTNQSHVLFNEIKPEIESFFEKIKNYEFDI